jgi:prepilin signal peptidase PulO-like enzyme (type II secretory pathway)
MFELLLVVIAGLAFGSFVTCASYRLPLGIDVVRKPSFCPTCATRLSFKDLCPVFSWVFTGGKCRYCAAKISLRYPLIEIVMSLIFILIYALCGLTLPAFILAGMAVCLMIMIVADLEHYIIPDVVHILLLPLAIAYRFAIETFSPDILWGFGLMTGIALLLHYGYSALRGRAMLGFGDVKFFAVVGVWLDISTIPIFLLLAGILGVIFGGIWRLIGKGQVFPFAPALAVSLFICVVFPELNILHK